MSQEIYTRTPADEAAEANAERSARNGAWEAWVNSDPKFHPKSPVDAIEMGKDPVRNGTVVRAAAKKITHMAIDAHMESLAAEDIKSDKAVMYYPEDDFDTGGTPYLVYRDQADPNHPAFHQVAQQVQPQTPEHAGK